MIDKSSMLPIYYQIKEMIIKQIREGQIKLDEKLLSEHELMRMFGVSRQPVIQAMKELEQEGWIYRIQGKGSFCSANRDIQCKNVGVVLNTVEHYIGAQIISGIMSALSMRNYNGVVKNVRYSPTDERETVMDMINHNVSGFIINNQYQYSTFSRQSGVLEKIEQRRIPYIVTDGSFENTDIPFIDVDDVKGGYIATKHLLSLGHRNIMMFSPHIGWAEKKRYEGYEKALAEYGMKPKQEYLVLGIKEEFDVEDAWGVNSPDMGNKNMSPQGIEETKSFSSIKAALENCPDMTAAFCYNDLYASLLIDILRYLGKRVPEDFSVVGFDDSFVAISGPVKLTTVAHPKFNYGAQAANVLLDIIEGKKPRDYQELMDVELVVRDSCIKI